MAEGVGGIHCCVGGEHAYVVKKGGGGLIVLWRSLSDCL